MSEGRNIPRDKVKTFADGRVFTGKQAKELGLVDEIGFMDKAIEVAESEAGISNATVVTYQYTDFWSLVMGITSKVSPLSSILEQTDIVPGAKLMYMFDAN